MGKYESLTRYLANLDRESWEARFDDVERILGFELPDSAYSYPAWWANQAGHHSQTKGWRDAGWETSNVNLSAKRIRFVRRHRKSSIGKTSQPENGVLDKNDVDHLIVTAKELSGIEDRNALLAAALTQFIQSEAAKGLIALSGTMPDFDPAPRRRID